MSHGHTKAAGPEIRDAAGTWILKSVCLFVCFSATRPASDIILAGISTTSFLCSRVHLGYLLIRVRPHHGSGDGEL